jgi:hypothetical protein
MGRNRAFPKGDNGMDLLNKLPDCQHGAVVFIDMQIAHLRGQIQKLEEARAILGGGIGEPNDGLNRVPVPNAEMLPIPPRDGEAKHRKGVNLPKHLKNTVLAQIGCVLLDGPLRMGLLLEKIDDRPSLQTVRAWMDRCPWFRVTGEKSKAIWHLTTEGIEASKNGFRTASAFSVLNATEMEESAIPSARAS